ncbi:MAG: DNA primase, partial [Lachnospiraceae bacterium]|nr:DNA primase [Lachnospiraceae bacterium]
TLDDNWKIKGLRKYTYFRGWNGGMQVLYGLFENLEAIKKERKVIIFEGAKSVMLADSYGFHNTAALLTSHVNPAQMRTLIQLSCEVIFALDKDVSVKDDHNIKRLKQFTNVSYIWDKDNLLDEKDSPIDKGAEVFKHLLEERRRYI